MSDIEPSEKPRTAIGGRYGSPTITVALPFANIVSKDTLLRDAVADLAAVVARLAQAVEAGDTDALATVREAAEELAARVSSSRD